MSFKVWVSGTGRNIFRNTGPCGSQIFVKQCNNGIDQYCRIDPRHVTFDEYKFLGAPEIEPIMDKENQLDHDFTSDQFGETNGKSDEDHESVIDELMI